MKILHRKNPTAVFTLIKFIGYALFGSGVIFTFQASAEGVDSLSSELLKQVGEDAFWEAKVKCEGNFTSVVIRQKLKQDDWCIKDGQLSCKKTKLKMAEEVCLNIQTLAKPAPKPVTRVVTAQQAQQSSRAAELKKAKTEKAAQDRRIARIKVEQEAKERLERDRLALASALNEEQLLLQEARLILNQEKLEVDQMELRLESRAREIEKKLKSLEN